MTTALKAIDADCVAPDRLRLERVAHRGAFVDDLDARVVQCRQPFLRVVSSGLDNLDAAVDYCLDVARVVRWIAGGKKRKVDTKRLVGHVAAAPNLPRQIFGTGLGEGRQDAEAACIRDGGG